jgi:TonB family protein
MVEQPKVREEVRAEQPMEKVDPRPAAPTPPGPPALDAKAEGPGDAFALGGKPGGGDFLGGGGGGGGGSKYGWYAAMIQGHVQRSVQSQPNLQRTRYRVSVEIWLSADGTPQRVELISSTGAAELDQKLREALLRMSRMPQPPPSDLPQPVVLQVSSS